MARKLPLFAVILFALCASAQHRPPHTGTQPPGNTLTPIPADYMADSYAIYSLLLPGSPNDTIARTPTQNWVLADTTINITDMNPAVPPDGQLKPPSDNARAFTGALHDFEAGKYERFHLDSKSFPPGHTLSLVSEKQASNIRQSGDPHTGIVSFSAVYFNGPRTAALVYVNDWCANLCAAGQWVYLEKQNGQWVRRSGI